MYHVTVLSDPDPERSELETWLSKDPQLTLHLAEVGREDSPAGQFPAAADLLLFSVPRSGWIDIVRREPGVLVQHPCLIVIAPDMDFIRNAFACRALDYLVKPLARESFLQSIAWGKCQVDRRRRIAASEPLLPPEELTFHPSGHIERIMVRSGPHALLIKVAEVDWIEAVGNYVRLHAGGKSHFLRHTMAFFESHLPAELFARVHRSAIVNLDRVREMEQTGNGDNVLVLGDGTRLPMGRSYRRALVERFVG